VPRSPENKDKLVSYDDLSQADKDNAIIIFFSHCWMRGYSAAPGYDGRPHPDNANHDKYKLMVESVERIMKTLTSMEKCYVWLDYGCIDQDASACLELRMLDKIVGVCDLILTNVVDSGDWIMPSSIYNLFEEYKSPAWNGGVHSYLNRAWCRVEMLYAANIPLVNTSPSRLSKLKAGLLSSAESNRRPHLLYGTRESKSNGLNPIQLPPMQNSWFEKYGPAKGNLTNEADRVKVEKLVEDIKPYMTFVKEGYTGIIYYSIIYIYTYILQMCVF
jgi:hypothetical protein